MPQRNIVKTYVADGYYHIYNRGVEKRIIFVDEQDYKVFLKYLKEYLSEPPKSHDMAKNFTLQGETFKGIPKMPKNYTNEIELIAYTLMPNHFHLLIRQINQNSMQKFLQSISTRYSIYFNKKYERVGTLFQGAYKAVIISDESYLLHLSRYIHLNPSKHTKDLANAYSSYGDYLKLRNTTWVKPEIVLSFFNQATLPGIQKTNSYKDFVENYKQDSGEILQELTLEEE